MSEAEKVNNGIQQEETTMEDLKEFISNNTPKTSRNARKAVEDNFEEICILREKGYSFAMIAKYLNEYKQVKIANSSLCNNFHRSIKTARRNSPKSH